MADTISLPGAGEHATPPNHGERLADSPEEQIIRRILGEEGLPPGRKLPDGFLKTDLGQTTIDGSDIPHEHRNARTPKDRPYHEVIGAVTQWRNEPRRLDSLIITWGNRTDEGSNRTRLRIVHGDDGGLFLETSRVNETTSDDGVKIPERPDPILEPINADNIDAVLAEIYEHGVKPFLQPTSPGSEPIATN